MRGEAIQSYIRAVEIGSAKNIKKEVLDMLLSILGLSEEETRLLYELERKDLPVARVWDGTLHTESFGSYIRSLRLRSGYTQEAVGDILGVTKQAVSLAEKGGGADFARTRTGKLAEIFELSKEETETLERLAGSDYIGKVRIFRKENSNEEHEDRLV